MKGLLLVLQLALAPAAEVRVVDGDTLDVGPVRYRVADLDAPETNGRCQAERAAAARATAAARALLDRASSVAFEVVDVQPARGRYRERLVARVTVDGQDFAAALVAQGVARPWGQGPAWCAVLR